MVSLNLRGFMERKTHSLAWQQPRWQEASRPRHFDLRPSPQINHTASATSRISHQK
jgi:hypothetical protein